MNEADEKELMADIDWDSYKLSDNKMFAYIKSKRYNRTYIIDRSCYDLGMRAEYMDNDLCINWLDIDWLATAPANMIEQVLNG